RVSFQFTEIGFPVFDSLPDSIVVATVALADETGQTAILFDLMRNLEPQRERIHAADVRMKQIFEIRAGSADFCIEVQSPRRQTALIEDHQQHADDFTDVGWKLIGVPSQKLIPAVGVNASQKA